MVYLEGRSAVGVVMLLYMFSVVISAPSGTKEWTVTALKHSKQYEVSIAGLAMEIPPWY